VPDRRRSGRLLAGRPSGPCWMRLSWVTSAVHQEPVVVLRKTPMPNLALQADEAGTRRYRTDVPVAAPCSLTEGCAAWCPVSRGNLVPLAGGSGVAVSAMRTIRPGHATVV